MSAVLEDPEVKTPHTCAGDHILDGAANPPEAMVWTMLCGAQCFAWDDGTLTPKLDFYLLENGAEKASCSECRKRAGLK